MGSSLRHYELVVVLSPILNQDQASDVWGRIKDFISNRNGDITHEEIWGTRRLAYPIRKGSYQFLEGNYHLTRFSTEQSFNKELNTFLRLDEQVLRSLVVTTFAPGEEPKPPPPRVRRPDPALAGQAPPAEGAEAAAQAPSAETGSAVAVAEAPAAEAPEEAADPAATADDAEAPAAEEPEESQPVDSTEESSESEAVADTPADDAEAEAPAVDEPEPAVPEAEAEPEPEAAAEESSEAEDAGDEKA